MKIRALGAELFRTDGRSVRHDEANSHYSILCECAQNLLVSLTSGTDRGLQNKEQVSEHGITDQKYITIYWTVQQCCTFNEPYWVFGGQNKRVSV